MITFLPIVERELRVRSRWRSTYWMRCLSALAASGIAMVMLTVGLVAGPGRLGPAMFATMAWLAWVFCLVEGFRNTADSLSEEKREGTLGLLFLTDLKGYDVAIGKFAGSFLAAVFPLLAMLPMLGLSILQGGVTAAEYWRMCLALVNTLFFSLAAGLFVSAVTRQTRRAWMGSILIMLFFSVVVPLVEHFTGWVGAGMALGSPWTPFHFAFDSGYRSNPARFWNATWVVHLLAWLWLALASVLLPRMWREKEDRLARGRSRGAAGRIGDPGGAAHLRSLDPLLWLASREGRQGRLALILAGGACVAGVVTTAASLADPSVMLGLWLFAFLFHQLVCLWVAWEACNSFSGLKQSGMLELLLVTPLPIMRLVEGEFAALRAVFKWPVGLVVGTELAALVTVCALEISKRSSGQPMTLVFAGVLVAGGLGLWILDLFTVARVGMWLSLVSRQPAQAWGKTILWVVAAPVPILLLSGMVCFCFATPFLLLAKDLLFLQWANTNLRNRVRLEAARQPSPRGG